MSFHAYMPILLTFSQVCFVGEVAVDTGGPAREFWRLLVTGIKSDYCRTGEGGCFFDRNVSAMQVNTLHQRCHHWSHYYFINRGLTSRALASSLQCQLRKEDLDFQLFTRPCIITWLLAASW